MVMVKTIIKTDTYNLDGNYFIDIQEFADEYIAYIYNLNMNTSKLMFLRQNKDKYPSKDHFLNTVETMIDEAIDNYNKEVEP